MKSENAGSESTDQIPVTPKMMAAGAEAISGTRVSDFIGTDLADLPFVWAWAAYIYRQMEAARAGR